MEITELLPTRFDLPGGGSVYIATQRWALERWEGEDPPELGPTWSRKGKFSVSGGRSCAELAVLRHLRDDGWQGVWVNSYGPGELRSDWFPAPAVKTITQTGAPPWAVEIFDGLRAANGGKLNGFFDVFAWRELGEVRFDEVKVGRDDIRLNQLTFVELALGLGHRLDQFTIVEVPGVTTPLPAELRIRSRRSPQPGTLAAVRAGSMRNSRSQSMVVPRRRVCGPSCGMDPGRA